MHRLGRAGCIAGVVGVAHVCIPDMGEHPREAAIGALRWPARIATAPSSPAGEQTNEEARPLRIETLLILFRSGYIPTAPSLQVRVNARGGPRFLRIETLLVRLRRAGRI